MIVNQKTVGIFSKNTDFFVVYNRSVEFLKPYNC